MPTLETFGDLDGLPLVRAELTGSECSVAILSLGATTQDWRMEAGSGIRPIVLGYADPRAYLVDRAFFGAIVGRVANRIAGGRFVLEGRVYQLVLNDGRNHLHGGPEGLSRRNFTLEIDSAANAVELRHVSQDGAGGYPGRLDITVTITLSGTRLTYDLRAVPNMATPVNLAQHNYYNLDGASECRDHVVWLDAPQFTAVDEELIPTGEVLSVAGTRFDLTNSKRLANADPARSGYDINLVLRPDRDRSDPVGVLEAGGLRLRMWSDQPGIQLYDCVHLAPTAGGHGGRTYGQFAGLALEPQAFPNAVNIPAFPSVLCTPEAPYHQRLEVEISREDRL